jgi:tetratricopeptide (TPR) repeat protein
LYALAREQRDPASEFFANHVTGYVAQAMGQFRKAEQFLGAAAASGSRVPAVLRGHALVVRGNALWFLGFPDQALALARKGLMLGEHADDRYTYAAALEWAGFAHMYCGELAQAEELFRTSLNLGTERGFPYARAINTLFLGLASALRRQTEASLEQLRRGTEFFAASSAAIKLERLFHGELALAWGYELLGRPDAAFATLLSDIEWMEQSGAEAKLASMHLLKGRLFEGKSNTKEAENSFRTSIEIARRQSAKSLELRATTSLTRLLAKQGRRDEGRAMLAEIYGWFTEGFDTADLKDAKALLEELKS